MTVQEAIRRIKDHFRVHDDGRPTPYLDKAVEMAIEALEKQIPKKPNRHEEEITDDYVSLEYYSCPVCKNNELADGYDFYCFRCGQKLDWSEKND